jgi:hypothetical protein
MPTTPFTLRRATGDDADAVAEVFSASFRLLCFFARTPYRCGGPLVYRERDPEEL